LAIGTQNAELVSTEDTLTVVSLRPDALATSTPVGEVAGDFLFNKGQIVLYLPSRSIIIRS